jgi:hypothetical protein
MSTSKGTSHAAPAPPRSSAASASAIVKGPGPALTVVSAWLVPGAGHFLHRQPQKATVIFVVLVAMVVIGLGAGGRLFPFDTSEPLVLLAAAAQWMMGVPRLVAAMAGWGHGEVTAVSFEYGNTFLIVAGLLNVLVMFDAYDLATGRKTVTAGTPRS